MLTHQHRLGKVLRIGRKKRLRERRAKSRKNQAEPLKYPEKRLVRKKSAEILGIGSFLCKIMHFFDNFI